jgi:hypothetical protein
MYLLWYAMFAQLTSLAKTPCCCSVFTNSFMESAGPDSVQKFGPLWHATSMSGGHSCLASLAPRPATFHPSLLTHIKTGVDQKSWFRHKCYSSQLHKKNMIMLSGRLRPYFLHANEPSFIII